MFFFLPWTELSSACKEAGDSGLELLSAMEKGMLLFCCFNRILPLGCPSLWLVETFSLKLLDRIHRNLTGSKNSTSFTKFVLFGPTGKQNGHPNLWLAEIPYKRKFSRVSNFAILWSKVVSLFSRVQFFANLKIHQMLKPEIWLFKGM